MLSLVPTMANSYHFIDYQPHCIIFWCVCVYLINWNQRRNINQMIPKSIFCVVPIGVRTNSITSSHSTEANCSERNTMNQLEMRRGDHKKWNGATPGTQRKYMCTICHKLCSKNCNQPRSLSIICPICRPFNSTQWKINQSIGNRRLNKVKNEKKKEKSKKTESLSFVRHISYGWRVIFFL